MQKNKLLILLSEMNSIEQNAFIRFINSPYHNSNQTLCILAEYLITRVRENSAISLERNTIWSECFDPEPFDDDRMRKLQSQLVKLTEQFYAYEGIKSNEHALSYFALKESFNRGKFNILKYTKERYRKNYGSRLFFSLEESLFSYLSENIIYESTLDFSRRYSKSNIENIIKYLNSIYYTEFLRQICHLKTRDWEKLDNTETTIDFIINEYNKNESYWESFPGIEIYSRIYRSLTQIDDDQNFLQLRPLIKQFAYLFEVKDAKAMYHWLVHYSVTKLNKGHSEYLMQLFDIYKEFLQNELIYEDGKLHDYNFKNIVTTGLRAKEYDWVQYFIETYANKVPEEQRGNTVAYNLAQLNFYRGNFKGVLSLLQEVEYDDLTYNLGAKSMLMATYYELDELEPLYSLLDSFKVYLSRKQNIIPQDFRILYTNLIKFIKQLISIRQGETDRIDKFITDVRKAGSVASANWLLEKAEELR